MDMGTHYLENSLQEFRRLRTSCAKALAQVSDAEFFRQIDPGSNSLAAIVKHLAGNMHSRWRDFLTTDGEKPDRRRDTEFEIGPEDTREHLMARLQAGWRLLFDSLQPLRGEDLMRTVLIRAEPHTVIAAVNRQLTHYGEHTGQIVFLARHLAGEKWQTLSIPRGGSEAFNLKMGMK
jgi:hypothetical protein